MRRGIAASAAISALLAAGCGNGDKTAAVSTSTTSTTTGSATTWTTTTIASPTTTTAPTTTTVAPIATVSPTTTAPTTTAPTTTAPADWWGGTCNGASQYRGKWSFCTGQGGTLGETDWSADQPNGSPLEMGPPTGPLTFRDQAGAVLCSPMWSIDPVNPHASSAICRYGTSDPPVTVYYGGDQNYESATFTYNNMFGTWDRTQNP